MAGLKHFVHKLRIAKQIPIFSSLSWLQLRRIVRKSQLIEFKKGEIIYREGSDPDAFYCLVSGRLQAYTTRIDGKREDVELIHRGMHFSITALLTGDKHSLTYEAINDSVILKIEKEDFLNILKLIPRLGVEFSHSISQRIRRRNRYVKSVFESTIISVYSPIKSSGNSTYGINLSLSLARETGKKVIFVSIHSQKEEYSHPHSGEVDEASPRWKKPPIPLKDVKDDRDKIVAGISKGELPIDLLNVIFGTEDIFLVNQISQFVTDLAKDYHYVIVDLPNEMDDVVYKTLTQSDIVHIVTVNRQTDLSLSRHVIERLKSAFDDHAMKAQLKVIISGLNSQENLSYEQMNQEIGYGVDAMLPHIERENLKEAVVSETITLIIPKESSPYAQVITKIARQIGGVLVGLVLGGGAALGIAHIGVLKVLEKENIPVDIVVGSSIGAFIASLWAVGKNAAELETLAREFDGKIASLKLVDPIFPKSGFIGGRKIVRWLKRTLEDKTFYDTKIPLKIVAYDLLKREELVIDEGRLVDAVRQSIAIPGVIAPVVKPDQLIIDGGVVNPLPTNVLTARGIRKIIAVNVLQSPWDVTQGHDAYQAKLREEEKTPFRKAPWLYLGVRFHRLLKKIFYPNISDIIIRSLQATEYVIAEQSAQQAHVVIHPDLVGLNWFELYEVDKLIKSGEAAALAKLPEIRRLISE